MIDKNFPSIVLCSASTEITDCGITFTMEHYRKKRIRFYEAEALPNEIKVTNSSRAQEIASKAARKLKVCIKFLIHSVSI